MSKGRLHAVALPQCQTTAAYTSCAYTQKRVRFGKMMRPLGYEVILYSGEHNDAECDEHVPLLTERERAGWFGDGFDTVITPLRWDPSEPYWQTMNARAAAAINQRIASDQDLLLLIGGNCQKPIADWVRLMAVEDGVGYEGVFANHRVFESSAWMHYVYGKQGIVNGHFYDAVIPNFFDADDFHLADKGGYLLYVGRLVSRKGPHLAAQIAARCGMPLKVAGPGALRVEKPRRRRSYTDPGRIVAPDVTLEGDVEYVGEVDAAARAELMAGATALLVPTLYIEPFGGVAVEAMLSGTPVVASDFGAFTETVEEGVTGARFRTLAEAAAAVERVRTLDPSAIRRRAIERFSLPAVGAMYDRYFEQLHGLWGEGWTA